MDRVVCGPLTTRFPFFLAFEFPGAVRRLVIRCYLPDIQTTHRYPPDRWKGPGAAVRYPASGHLLYTDTVSSKSSPGQWRLVSVVRLPALTRIGLVLDSGAG